MCVFICERYAGVDAHEDETDGRNGEKRVSSFVNNPPKVQLFSLLPTPSICYFTAEASKCFQAFRGPLFSLIPDCVNTPACKHNDDLCLIHPDDTILEGMQKEVL